MRLRDVADAAQEFFVSGTFTAPYCGHLTSTPSP